jgi:hypothetical protein
MGVGELLKMLLGRVLYFGMMGVVGNQLMESVERMLLVDGTKTRQQR